MVVERKDGHGGGARHVVRRQARAGLHETRGAERGGRRLRQLGDDRSQRRAGGRGSRRPLDALVAERTGFALLREIRPRADLRACGPAGGIRHGEGRLRPLGAVPDSGADAPDDPHGPFAGRRRDGRGARRKPVEPSRTAPPVGADAGKLARAIPDAAGGLRPAGRGVRRQPVQRLYGGSGQTAGHRRLRHRTQLPDGELPRRMSAPGAENRAVPAAPHAGAPYRRRVRHAADPRRGPARRGRDRPGRAAQSRGDPRTPDRRTAPHRGADARQRARGPRHGAPGRTPQAESSYPARPRSARDADTATCTQP